jgi:hypothetical protein
MIFNDLKPQLSELRRRQVVNTKDTRFETERPSWVCACADLAGASYYATKHNRSAEHNAPILIRFDADIRYVIIDGRDFLYTVFQLGNPELARPLVRRLYGDAILYYLDRAWATDQSQRLGMCDLATQDDEVISAHARNDALIAGRYGTCFRTAFMVQTPVGPKRILDVSTAEQEIELPTPDVTLDMIRQNGRP